MGQNRLDSTLFLLSLKLSAGDLCLTRICILQHLLSEDTNLKERKKRKICKKDLHFIQIYQGVFSRISERKKK